MQNKLSERKSKKLGISVIVTLFTVLLFSCSTTKRLSDDELLLSGNTVRFSDTLSLADKGYITEDIEDLLLPKPNSKILFVPFYLHIYNLSDPEKFQVKKEKKENKCSAKQEKKLLKFDNEIRKLEKERNLYEPASEDYLKYDKKLKKLQETKNELKQEECEFESVFRKIGEAPVIFDKNDAFKTKKQIEIFFRNKGYYSVRVEDQTIKHENKKVSVLYNISPGKPILINNIEYSIQDPFINNTVLSDTSAALIKKGSRLDVELLQNERARIAANLRDLGYYRFSKDYITYTIDTLSGNSTASIMLIFKQFRNEDGTLENHKKYRINNTYIYTNYDAKKALSENETYFAGFDTTLYSLSEVRNYFFLNNSKQTIKSGAIARGAYLFKDSLYNQTDVKDTYKYLSAMKIIKIANLNFIDVKPERKIYDTIFVANNEKNDTIVQEYGFLDCELRLTQDKLQEATFELEGTNSSGNIGAAGNLIYRHRNIFRHAEVFDLKFKTALERQTNYAKNVEIPQVSNISFFNSREFGLEFLIDFPRLLSPIKGYDFSKRYTPKTLASFTYNYMSRPDYTRTIAGLSYGYFWSSSEKQSHILKPIVFDLVELRNPTEKFLNYINTFGLHESYENHLILASSYSLIINNQKKSKKRNYSYIRINGKSAGNLLKTAMDLAGTEKKDGQYVIGNTVFAQFLKADIDYRYYKKLSRENDKLIYRVFAGVALPYGNLKVIPFGEKYFSGGANGIRAWQVRSLGPGSYSISDTTDLFLNLTADIKFESNFEYRMKLFWMLEGAFFIDVGNIWAINSHDDRSGAMFELKDFYKELAVGTGYGFRFDFDFFIIRFDFGMKIVDPAYPLGKRLIPFNRKYTSNDFAFNVGIGYPF